MSWNIGHIIQPASSKRWRKASQHIPLGSCSKTFHYTCCLIGILIIYNGFIMFTPHITGYCCIPGIYPKTTRGPFFIARILQTTKMKKQASARTLGTLISLVSLENPHGKMDNSTHIKSVVCSRFAKFKSFERRVLLKITCGWSLINHRTIVAYDVEVGQLVTY